MPDDRSFMELGVVDAAAARRFYGGLLGWDFGDGSGSGLAETPSTRVGLHGDDPFAWFEPFFAVDDLDAGLARLTELGGVVRGDVHDDPSFGRWVECADDQGVRFGLRQPG